jgi:hypothetical protein
MRTIKSIVNAASGALRTVLGKMSGKRRRFRQRTFSLGVGQPRRFDKALEMAAAIEDEEILRKMAMGK